MSDSLFFALQYPTGSADLRLSAGAELDGQMAFAIERCFYGTPAGIISFLAGADGGAGRFHPGTDDYSIDELAANFPESPIAHVETFDLP